MQKKILALAIAATVSAPAFAESINVNIYGTADLSFDFIDTGTTAAGVAGVNKTNVSSNVSKIGFKGSSREFDNGMSVIWQLEQQVNFDNTGGTFATRNTFAGVKSKSMGTVLLGRHDTPYKISTRKLDPFGDSIADNRALLGGVAGKSSQVAFDGRDADVIAYISPAMSGFTGAIAYLNLAETNTLATQAKSSAVSLAGMYDSAPFYGSLAYEEHKLDTVLADGKESAWKLGLGYMMDAFTVGFGYEKSKDNLTPVTLANKFGHNAYFLSGTYMVGSEAVRDAIKFEYGKAGQVGSTANTDANYYALGYDLNFDKSTKLYAIYSRLSNSSGSSYLFTQSSAAAATSAGAGASPSVVSLGVKYSF